MCMPPSGRCIQCRSENECICLLKTEMLQNWSFTPFRVQLYQIGDCFYYSDYHLLHLIAHLLYSEGENRSNGERKMQSRCQTSTWLTTYRNSLCVKARPCHLMFPLSLILQTLLATRYWFFILLNIPLAVNRIYSVSRRPPLPSQCSRDLLTHKEGTLEACPPLAPVVRSYLRKRRHGNWQYRQKWNLC